MTEQNIEEEARAEAKKRTKGFALGPDLDDEYESGFRNGVHWLINEKGYIAGASREPAPADDYTVTDEMIEAGAVALAKWDGWSWPEVSSGYPPPGQISRDSYRAGARAVLEAALSGGEA